MNLEQKWGSANDTTWVGGPLDGWQIPAYSDMTPAQEYWARRVADAGDELGYEVAMRGWCRPSSGRGRPASATGSTGSSPRARFTGSRTTRSPGSSTSHSAPSTAASATPSDPRPRTSRDPEEVTMSMTQDPFYEVREEAARQRRLALKFGDTAYVPGARYEDMPRLMKATFLEKLCDALADHWNGLEPR